MFVVSLLSQKGGTGKSTLAIQLAVAAMLDGHTVIIIDLDSAGICCDVGGHTGGRASYCCLCNENGVTETAENCRAERRDPRDFGHTAKGGAGGRSTPRRAGF